MAGDAKMLRMLFAAYVACPAAQRAWEDAVAQKAHAS